MKEVKEKKLLLDLEKLIRTSKKDSKKQTKNLKSSIQELTE